jgi:hypothetical protein
MDKFYEVSILEIILKRFFITKPLKSLEAKLLE